MALTPCVGFVRLLTGEQPEPHLGAGAAALVARIAQSRRPFERTGPPGGGVESEPELAIAVVAQCLRFRTEIERVKRRRSVCRRDRRPADCLDRMDANYESAGPSRQKGLPQTFPA